MSWNYRIIKRKWKKGVTFGIHEVYYDKDGQPTAWSTNPRDPHGETLDELRRDFDMMEKAFDHFPIDEAKLEKSLKKLDKSLKKGKKK